MVIAKWPNIFTYEGPAYNVSGTPVGGGCASVGQILGDLAADDGPGGPAHDEDLLARHEVERVAVGLEEVPDEGRDLSHQPATDDAGTTTGSSCLRMMSR